MPRQPEVHFRLKPKDKDGNCLIYLQFVYRGNRLFYSFGQTVKPENWNTNKQRVKNKQATTTDGKFALNDLLDNLQAVCEKTYNESIKSGIPEPDTLKKALQDFINQNHSDTGKPTLYTLAERFISGEIKNRGKDKSKASLNNYRSVVIHLKSFGTAKKYKVDFDTINLDFFYSYVTYLRKTLKLAVNTIAKDISILKVFMGEAVDLGYTDNLQFKHKKFSFTEQETDQVYLTEQELNTLYKFKCKSDKLEQVKDLFVFGAWVGLRFGDYNNIKPENIRKYEDGYFIDLITKKTNERVIVPCNPVVIELMEKYSHNANKLPKSISNQKFNDYIKEVCRDAELNEKGRLNSTPDVMLWQAVSSHTCRRSFATNYYLQGFPTIELMKMTAHKSEKAFLKYIRVSKLDAAKRLAAHIKLNWSKKLLRIA